MVFRIEKPFRKPDQRIYHRFIDIDFSPSYVLRNTHQQRLATEFRVPLFEGFTMPSALVDPETAGLYKQLLLRPLKVESSRELSAETLVSAFETLSEDSGEIGMSRDKIGSAAFSRNWCKFGDRQHSDSIAARKCFLERYEWPSRWETQEVHQELSSMWHEEWLDNEDEQHDTDARHSREIDPPHCHDRLKARPLLLSMLH